ncbi:hypothetical protein AYK59_17210 [Pseudomonas synxantha]|nr:hypothetical protein AYK59_17210 [Pseudomonas synxantha]
MTDFNLLITLDILLAEGSVARAAKRLRLSPSAMSRALARLRAATGDPLLVRAGHVTDVHRGNALAPTPGCRPGPSLAARLPARGMRAMTGPQRVQSPLP